VNSIDIAAIGLAQTTERLNVTAHNVANLSTPAYKRRVAVQQPFGQAMQSETAAQALLSVHTDATAGKMSLTGNALDVALPANLFIEVMRADGSLALTKQGRLRLDGTGRLVTVAGDQVRGESGELRISKLAQDVSINARGQLVADADVIGSLRLVEVADTKALQAMGDGLYVADAGAARRPDAISVQPRHVEASNVLSAHEMVQLMNTTRHAEALVKLIQGADDLLEKAIRKFGESQ
jgi:flagellar basal-body rod protein FlgF